MAGRLTVFILAATLGSCAPSAQTAPVRYPSWNAAQDSSPLVRVTQTAEFVGDELRICARVENISQGRIVIRRFEPPGHGYRLDFGMSFYSRRGRWLPPPCGADMSCHPPRIMPRPPASEDDISIYSDLAPGESAGDCENFEILDGRPVYQAVTTYQSRLLTDLVPARLREGRTLVDRSFGAVRSAPCVIDVARRVTRC